MHLAAAIVLLLSIGIYCWRRRDAGRGKHVFGVARDMERGGNYEAACFHYAVAATPVMTRSCAVGRSSSSGTPTDHFNSRNS